jgi:putative hemolysin
MSDEELESFIDLWKQSWSIDNQTHKKLIWVLELDNLTAEDIMTPRVDIQGLPDTATIAQAIEHFFEHNHTRIPIYDKEVDKIHSFITMRDLFILKQKGEENKKISEVSLHKVLKIPLNQPLDRLLELLQKNNKHLATVIDEYGGVSWIITMEDIIEEVFGEIQDETDEELEEIKHIKKDELQVDATVMIDEVLEVFDLELYHIGLDVKEFSAETIGFIITHRLERFPHTKEEIEFDIVEKDDRSGDIEKIVCKILDIENSKIGHIAVSIYRTEKELKK